jgi:hypothetical protein
MLSLMSNSDFVGGSNLKANVSVSILSNPHESLIHAQPHGIFMVKVGVIFKIKAERQRWGGLVAIFLDPDGNEFTVVEDHEHYTRASGQTSHV